MFNQLIVIFNHSCRPFVVPGRVWRFIDAYRRQSWDGLLISRCPTSRSQFRLAGVQAAWKMDSALIMARETIEVSSPKGLIIGLTDTRRPSRRKVSPSISPSQKGHARVGFRWIIVSRQVKRFYSMPKN